MDYRPLGRTGIDVSAMSIGSAAIGQQYGPVTTAQAAECIHAAIDAGVNLVDTAAYYGVGLAETILGEVLEGGWREKVTLCTKACRLDTAVFDFTPEGTRKCFEASLRRLRVDHVDVLFAHDIEFADDYEFVFNETYRVLQDLRKEGKTRFIGMSCYPLGLLKQAIERCDLDVVISYAHFSLQNQRLLTELLPVAESRGVGVMNASPLALGLLTNHGPQPWFPGQPELKTVCKQAADLCRNRGADIAFLGMQYCFAEKRIPTTLTGTAKKAELEMNLRAMREPIDGQLLAEVQKVLEPVKDLTWPSGNWKK
jgi:L-galactose dehydrogenase